MKTIDFLVLVLIVPLLIAALAGCDTPASGLPEDAFDAEATAVVALALEAGTDTTEEATPDPEPAPKPDDNTCPTCGGSGRPDGRIPCPKCGGDGKIDPSDPAPAAINRQVTLHTDKATAKKWPLDWFKQERDALRDMGVEVVLQTEPDGQGAWLVICRGDLCLRSDRYMTATELQPLVSE